MDISAGTTCGGSIGSAIVSGSFSFAYDQPNTTAYGIADVTAWQPPKPYDIWHDRAAFHFLTDAKDRAAYIERLTRGLERELHVGCTDGLGAVVADREHTGHQRVVVIEELLNQAHLVGRAVGVGPEYCCVLL